MKILKIKLEAAPERPRTQDRYTRQLQRPFDRVAYTAALEVLG